MRPAETARTQVAEGLHIEQQSPFAPQYRKHAFTPMKSVLLKDRQRVYDNSGIWGAASVRVLPDSLGSSKTSTSKRNGWKPERL